MKNQQRKNIHKILKEKEYQFKNERWEDIIKNTLDYECIVIADMMHWFNIRDEEEIQRKLKLYMRERKNWGEAFQ